MAPPTRRPSQVTSPCCVLSVRAVVATVPCRALVVNRAVLLSRAAMQDMLNFLRTLSGLETPFFNSNHVSTPALLAPCVPPLTARVTACCRQISEIVRRHVIPDYGVNPEYDAEIALLPRRQGPLSRRASRTVLCSPMCGHACVQLRTRASTFRASRRRFGMWRSLDTPE